MRYSLLLLVLVPGLTFFPLGCGPSGSETVGAESPPDSLRQDVEQAVVSLNKMRESLAATIDTPTVDKRTFKRVCKPVGQRAKQISATRGWVVQQLSKKYRNPTHELDTEAQQFHKQFAQSPDLTETWIRTVRNGREGWRYARRITVQSSCLACHGPKEQRPDFVKADYPEDRAYGFETGDLRGIYSVFVPDSPPDTSTADAF